MTTKNTPMARRHGYARRNRLRGCGPLVWRMNRAEPRMVRGATSIARPPIVSLGTPCSMSLRVVTASAAANAMRAVSNMQVNHRTGCSLMSCHICGWATNGPGSGGTVRSHTQSLYSLLVSLYSPLVSIYSPLVSLYSLCPASRMWAQFFLAGSGPGKLASPAHQAALEKSLGIKDQSCPMLRWSHRAMW